MSISSKVKAVLAVGDKKMGDVPEVLGLTRQAVNAKVVRNSFSVSDVVRIMDYLGGQVILRTSDGIEVPVTLDDVEKSVDIPSQT